MRSRLPQAWYDEFEQFLDQHPPERHPFGTRNVNLDVAHRQDETVAMLEIALARSERGADVVT